MDNRVVRMINHATFYEKKTMSPGNLQKQCLRLRQEGAARQEGQQTEGSEDPEQQSRESEPSQEETSSNPADEDATKDQEGDGSVSSPSEQAPPTETGPQED